MRGRGTLDRWNVFYARTLFAGYAGWQPARCSAVRCVRETQIAVGNVCRANQSLAGWATETARPRRRQRETICDLPVLRVESPRNSLGGAHRRLIRGLRMVAAIVEALVSGRARAAQADRNRIAAQSCLFEADFQISACATGARLDEVWTICKCYPE